MRRGLSIALAVASFAAAGALTGTAAADNGIAAGGSSALPNASVQGYGGVQVITIRPSSEVQGVAGASHTVKKGTAQSPAAAPLSATHTSGTLPFTGLQLTIAVALGAALLGGGFLLRRAAREGSGS
jgi:hypothetical protein